MKKVLRKFFLLMMLCVVGTVNASATDYISDIKVGVGSSKETAQGYLSGYTILDANFAYNSSTSCTRYSYIGYKTSTDCKDAITGLLLSTTNPSSITYNGCTYYPATQEGTLDGYSGIFSINNDGTTLYLYYTKTKTESNTQFLTAITRTSVRSTAKTIPDGTVVTYLSSESTATYSTAYSSSGSTGAFYYYLTATYKSHSHDAIFSYLNNGDGTHSYYCTACGYVKSTVAHSFTLTTNDDGSKKAECACGLIHTFAADDEAMGVCTTCNHGFFRYTADAVVTPYRPANLLDADRKKLNIISNTCTDGNGVIEFEKPLITIEENAFCNCTGLTGNLTIPNSVTSIGTWAFGYCTGLTGNLTIPNSVTSIGTYAFHKCTGFNGSLTIPNSVTSIGNCAFYNCYGLNGSLTIPNSVTSIGKCAFYNCTGFTGSLIIPNSVTSIGDYAFYQCTGFTGIELNSIPTFGSDVFYGCTTSNVTLALADDSYVYTSSKDNFPSLASAPTYTRTMSSNWGTIVLPFAIQSNDSYQLYTLSSVTTGDNGVMRFTATDDEVAAGTPCVFKKKDESATEVTFTATSTSVDATTTLTASPITNWTINGTYTKLTDQTGMYFIAQDKFWKADAAITINPFRAWFTNSSSAAKSFNIVVEDETEGINLTPALSQGEGVSKYLENGKVVIVRNGKKFNVNGQEIK